MTITYELQNTTQLKLFKVRKQVDELMQLTTSTLYGMGIDANKLDKMDDTIDFCLSVPFTEKKYKKAIELLKNPVRQQIAI